MEGIQEAKRSANENVTSNSIVEEARLYPEVRNHCLWIPAYCEAASYFLLDRCDSPSFVTSRGRSGCNTGARHSAYLHKQAICASARLSAVQNCTGALPQTTGKRLGQIVRFDLQTPDSPAAAPPPAGSRGLGHLSREEEPSFRGANSELRQKARHTLENLLAGNVRFRRVRDRVTPCPLCTSCACWPAACMPAWLAFCKLPNLGGERGQS